MPWSTASPTSAGVNERGSSITKAARKSLSTVKSVLSVITPFKLFCLIIGLLPDRYAFTVPAIGFLGTYDYHVMLPDMFSIPTASFLSPALIWALTSIIVPNLFGYFFNFSRGRTSGPECSIDPLTSSIARAITAYIVYVQGFTFAGWIDPAAVARINSTLYSGWEGVLVGAIASVAAIY